MPTGSPVPPELLEGGPLILRVQREGDHEEVRVFPVEHGPVGIGRALDNEIVLRDPLVSRRHIRIDRDPGGTCRARDQGSQNGSRLNGVLFSESLLKAGDLLQVGRTRIAVERAGEVDQTRAAGPDETVNKRVFSGRERMLALQEINSALNAERDPGNLLLLIVDAALELSGGERGFLLLDEGQGLACKVARLATGEELGPGEAQFSRRLAEEVRSSGEPRLAADALDEEDLRSIPSLMDIGVRSVLCVPLTVRGKVEGVLYVDHRLKTSAFTEEDLDLLEGFADQAGIAVANARLYRELLARQEQLEASAREVARLNAALEARVASQERELLSAREELRTSRGDGYGGIMGRSDAIRQVFQLIDRFVETEDPVLIQGESGTGKELVARAIHRLGRRSAAPFVTENCAAIPVELLESELFGYLKGSFTGASRNRKGLLEAASGGTLFLDEVGDMPLEIQKKLLRVLQDGEVRPLGAERTLRVDVRIVAASNRPLKELVQAGAFREDLFYRLNVLPLVVPPLRARREDIPLLVDHFLRRAAPGRSGAAAIVSGAAMDTLVAYSWPGNVRQLENELKRAAILAEGEIRPEHLSPEVREGALALPDAPLSGVTLPEKVRALQHREIKRVLEECAGNRSRAAVKLGISRFSLQRLMEKFELKGAEEPAEPEDVLDQDPEPE